MSVPNSSPQGRGKSRRKRNLVLRNFKVAFEIPKQVRNDRKNTVCHAELVSASSCC